MINRIKHRIPQSDGESLDGSLPTRSLHPSQELLEAASLKVRQTARNYPMAVLIAGAALGICMGFFMKRRR
ncbi:MAG: hypothetical protein R3C20_11550 [Planctomycetaceae bacterium]